MSSDSAESALPLPPGESNAIAAAPTATKNGAEHPQDVIRRAANETEVARELQPDDSAAAELVEEDTSSGSDESAALADEDEQPPADDASPRNSSDDLPPEVLTSEVVGFLIRAMPQKALWQWLGDDERMWLQQRMTRGFQNTIRALKQVAVRTRLIDHLQRDVNDFKAVARLWAETEPVPEIIAAIRALPDDLDWADEQLARQAFSVLRPFETPAISLALVAPEHRSILDAWLSFLAATPDRDLARDAKGDAAPHEYSYGAPDTASAGQPLDISTDASLASGQAPGNATPRSERRRGAAKQKAELERAQQEAARSRHQASQAKAEAASARIALETREAQARRDAQRSQLVLAQETRRGTQAEAALEETQKTLDRTNRRLKQSEKTSEDLAAEIKRLKRQVRQSQQLHEELKKQLASTTAKLQEAATRETQMQEARRAAAQHKATARPGAPRKSYSSPSISTAPLVAGAHSNDDYFNSMRRGASDASAPALLDQPFLWRGENRVFRVSAREVRRAIDRNDETFVFALIQGLDALREADARLHRVFLDRVRQAGRYYGRVLTTDTTRVLVDASNVARFEKNARGKGELSHLLAMRDELRRRDCFPIIMVADASLKHHIDDADELLAMARRGELEIAPAGTEADEYLAREARRSGAYVVSNDRTFHLKVAPDWEPLRINFRIHDGYILLDEF